MHVYKYAHYLISHFEPTIYVYRKNFGHRNFLKDPVEILANHADDFGRFWDSQTPIPCPECPLSSLHLLLLTPEIYYENNNTLVYAISAFISSRSMSLLSMSTSRISFVGC